ncbi:MAG: hypothetical protein CFH44_00251 [Proteobacteria bacterium]|nr:MAG: hypothetical protein CFH44_00251 [Pseudomonadota bacterium]|tara:strand:- start:1237 stop:1680 length:444 start_codon:yes stop_codon:yes gene_type:complete
MFDNIIFTDMFISIAILFLLFSFLSAVIIFHIVKKERVKNIENIHLIISIYDNVKDDEVASYVNESVRNYKAGANLNLQTEIYLTNTKQHLEEIIKMLRKGVASSANFKTEVKAYILNKKAYRHIKAYYPDGRKPLKSKTTNLKIIG